MKQIPFVWISLFLIGGIVLADFFNPDFLVSLGFFLLVLAVLTYFERTRSSVFYAKNAGFALMILVFLLGFARHAATLTKNDPSAIKNHYLESDKFTGSILALTPTQGEYSKAEFEVGQLIRFHDTIPVSGKIVLFLKDPTKSLHEFDVCLVNCPLNEVKNKHNPGEFDSELFWKHKGIDFIGFANEEDYVCIGKTEKPFFQFFTDLRNYFSAILDERLSGDELGVAKALILGDRSSLDSEITGKFGNTGAMHILAVSGLHVGILVQLLTLFLSLFKKWISKNRAIVLALLIVWIYSAMTGLSASVVRSAVMFTILSGSVVMGRNYNNFNVLCFSAVIILVWNPHFLYDIGFQLSYLAMLGIFMFYKPLSKVIVSRYKWVRLAIEGTMVGIAAQVMTVPLTLYYFHQFPNYFILTNLGLMVFSFLILALGIALFSFNWLNFFAKPLAFILSFSLYVMLLIIDFIDGLPGAVSSGFVLSSLLVMLFFLVIFCFYYALLEQRIKLLNISLLATSVLILIMVFKRYEGMTEKQICFFQSNEATFVVSLDQKHFVFYANRDKQVKKAAFLAKSYSQIYPGEVHFFEISGKKESHLKTNSHEISVERQKGGYEIRIDENRYFLATSLHHESSCEKTVLASWLGDSANNYQLKDRAIRFEID